MGAYTVVRAAHKTLSTTVQDTITLSGVFSKIVICNYAAAGGANLGFRVGFGSIPTDITTVGEDDSDICVPQGYVEVPVDPSANRSNTTTVKVKGSAQAYSVVGTR